MHCRGEPDSVGARTKSWDLYLEMVILGDERRCYSFWYYGCQKFCGCGPFLEAHGPRCAHLHIIINSPKILSSHWRKSHKGIPSRRKSIENGGCTAERVDSR
jgi:hypothetical protein